MVELQVESAIGMLGHITSFAHDEEQSDSNASDEEQSEDILSEDEESKDQHTRNRVNRLRIFCFGKELPTDTTNCFRFKKITSALIFIVLFYYDIITDILLAIEYHRVGEWMYFGLTIAFTAVPLGVVNVYNMYLLCSGENYASKHRCVPLRIMCSIPFMSAPVDGIVVISYCGLKHGVQWRKSEGDFGTYFKVIVGFMEDIPQLALQMYITLTESADDISMHTQVLRYISMLASWLSVSTSMLTYIVNDYEFQNEEKVPIFVQCMLFLYNGSETGLRVILFVVFTVQFKYIVLAVFFPHWIILLTWLIYYHLTTGKEGFPLGARILFFLTQSIILTFSSGVDKFQWRNSFSKPNGSINLKGLIFHLLIFIENVIMFVSWLCFTPLTGYIYYSIICSIAFLSVLCKATNLIIRQLNKDYV